MEKHGSSHQRKRKQMNWFLVTTCRREFLLGRDVWCWRGEERGVGGMGEGGVWRSVFHAIISLCATLVLIFVRVKPFFNKAKQNKTKK